MRVALGLSKSRIRPAKMVRLRDGLSGLMPRLVTMHTGASKPGFRRLRESMVQEMKGLVTS